MLGLAVTILMALSNPKFAWRRLAYAWVSLASIPLFLGVLLDQLIKDAPPPFNQLKFAIEPDLETKVFWFLGLLVFVVMDWLTTRK